MGVGETTNTKAQLGSDLGSAGGRVVMSALPRCVYTYTHTHTRVPARTHTYSFKMMTLYGEL